MNNPKNLTEAVLYAMPIEYAMLMKNLKNGLRERLKILRKLRKKVKGWVKGK